MMSATPHLERSLRYLLAWAPAVEAAKRSLSQRPVRDAVLHAGTLSFDAHSTFGSFHGETSHVTGAIVGAQDYGMTRGWVEASVATIVTGSGRRDRDLRAVLDVARHPTMHFELRGGTVVSASLGSRDVTTALLHGALSIRGVKRAVELPATITRNAAITRVSSVFSLDLADYGIGGLTRLLGILRVHPRIDIRVNLWFVDRLTDFTDDVIERARPA